jgi:hypothetical protein
MKLILTSYRPRFCILPIRTEIKFPRQLLLQTRFSKPRRNPIVCFGGETCGWTDGQTRVPYYSFISSLFKGRITMIPDRFVDSKNGHERKKRFVGRCSLTNVFSVAVSLIRFHSSIGLTSKTIFTVTARHCPNTTPAAEVTQLIL